MLSRSCLFDHYAINILTPTSKCAIISSTTFQMKLSRRRVMSSECRSLERTIYKQDRFVPTLLFTSEKKLMKLISLRIISHSAAVCKLCDVRLERSSSTLQWPNFHWPELLCAVSRSHFSFNRMQSLSFSVWSQINLDCLCFVLEQSKNQFTWTILSVSLSAVHQCIIVILFVWVKVYLCTKTIP